MSTSEQHTNDGKKVSFSECAACHEHSDHKLEDCPVFQLMSPTRRAVICTAPGVPRNVIYTHSVDMYTFVRRIRGPKESQERVSGGPPRAPGARLPFEIASRCGFVD